MSISSITSNPWAPSVPPQPSGDPSWNTLAAAQPNSGASTTAAATSANPFQQLSSDIQALLIQAQGQSGTGAPASASPSTSSTTTATPEQQLTSDLQSLFSQMQGSQSATQTADGTTASQSSAHHHHHHHADSDALSTLDSTDPTTTSSTAAASATPTSFGTPSLAQAFAADIGQAFQAYGGAASGNAAFALTA